MNAPTFYTPAFARKLEASGTDVRRAEALADALGGSIFETSATRSGLGELELAMKSDPRELKMKLQAGIWAPELRVTTRLGAALAASTASTVAVPGALISFH